MENLKLWAVSICGALVITAIFRIIISGSRLEKSVNIFMSVFIFLYSIIPIKDIGFDMEFISDIEDSNKDSIYHSGYESIVTESIKKVCDEKNININSIIIDSYIDSNGDYIINKINIESDLSDSDLIEILIKDELGYEVEVV